MRYEDFNDNQKEAISSSKVAGKKNIIVSAGAGSGKTEVLTQRVLYFNKNRNYRLNEFLILTFTKLAAGEMKERIRKALKEEGLEDANIVDTCDICTFDSYAFSIVKKYHYLLKLSPNIRIIDSSVISVKIRNIAKEIFEEYYKSKDTEFIKMIESFCFKDDNDLVDLAVRLHSKACLDTDFDECVSSFVQKYYYENKNVYKEIFDREKDELASLVENLEKFISGLPRVAISKDNTSFYNQEVNSLFRKFFNSKSYEEYIMNFPSEYKVSRPRKLNKNQKREIELYYSCCEDVKKFITSHPKTEQEFYDMIKFNERVATVLINIVKELEIRIQKYKFKHQIYEFNDIAKMALKLVKENKDVRESIKNKLKMIMVDEYQDTSIIQEKFIEQIQDNNVYMVGDIKQSIYRFRNAKSDIFRDKYEKYKKEDEGVAIDLNTNYRSRKEVLDDINYMFERIMTINCGGADYAKDHIIEYGNTAYLKAGDGGENKHLQTIVYDDVSYDEKPYTEANLIVKDIVNKINNHYKVFDKKTKNLRDCKFSDFCILMDRDTDFETYIKIFNEYHVPLFAESDENISSNEDIKVYSNILRLIKCVKTNDYISSEFNHSFVSLARSFVFQYSDQKLYELAKNQGYSSDEIVVNFKNIVLNNLDLPIYNLFYKIIFDMHIYDSFINVGNIDKHERYLDTFLEKFKEMSEIDYSLDDFLTYLEYVDEYELKITLSTKGSSIDSVRIMNIHKSKGLEFSVVYFSGLYKGFNRRDLEKEYNVSEHIGLIVPPVNRNQKRLLKEYHKEKEIIEDTSEKIRLFYVDATRTKEKMIFLMGDNPFMLRVKAILNYLKPLYYYLDDISVSKEEKLRLLFDKFIEQKINYSSFIYACDKYDINLPEKFLSSKLEKKLAYTFSKLSEQIKDEESLKEKMKKYIDSLDKNKDVFEQLFNLYKENKISLLQYNKALQILGKEVSLNLKNISKEKLEEMSWDDKVKQNYIVSYCKWNSINNWANYEQAKILLYMYLNGDDNFSINKYLYAKALSGNMEKEDDENLLISYSISLSCLKKVMNILGYKLKDDFISVCEKETIGIEKETDYIEYLFDENKIFISDEEIYKGVVDLCVNKEINISELELLMYGLNLHNKRRVSPVNLPYASLIEDITKNDIGKYIQEKRGEENIDNQFYWMPSVGKTIPKKFVDYLKKHIPYKLNQGYMTIIDRMIEERENEDKHYQDWLETNPGEYDEYIPSIDLKLYYSYAEVVKLLDDITIWVDIEYDKLETYNNESILENECIVKMILNSYFNNEISEETVEEYLDILDYKLTDVFRDCSFEERKKVLLKDVVDDIVGRNFYDGFSAKSLAGFFSNFMNYRHFFKTYGDIEIRSDYPNIKKEAIVYKNLNVKDLNIVKEEIVYNKSSKDLKTTSSKSSLEFGNYIHFLMEVIDFKNPDYDLIESDYFKNIVKRFLSCKLMEKVNEANIYKEYEFSDNSENTNGIIDLMLVYSDHIDIIDYKTKNIDDEGYDKQLNTYKKYINIKLNKPVNTYLYSLLTGDIKEVK